ncbi:MAG: hypothetical protein ACYC3X_28760 [Pirellulaceae bacterium]
MGTHRVAWILAFVAALLSLPCAAKSDFLVDFDKDPYGNVLSKGEVLTNQYAAWGVTFSAQENGSVVDSSLYNDGGNTGNTWINAANNDFSRQWDILRVEFASPAANVQWLTSSGGSKFITFRAYDASSNLLETVMTSGNLVPTGFSASGISRIDGEQPVDYWLWTMDNLSYSVVPEPSTLALWSLFGMIGGVVAWRKLKRG